MSTTIAQVQEHLIGMGHSGTLSKVRNFEAMCERAANTMRTKVKILESIRIQPLAQTIHDDVFNYALPADFDTPIDLIPQDNRTSLDQATRENLETFDLRKAIENKTITIEGSEGSKYLRANWRWRAAKILNQVDSLTANGTWGAVGSAAALATDTIYKVSGNGSVRFNLVASGDGIQNTTMSQVDLSDEDEIADFYATVYLPSTTGVTSISLVWGNDLTTKYWTGVAQTAQADGTAFKVGWNLIRVPWSSATETGTVVPSTIDSAKVTIAASSPLTNVRVDNIVCSIGRPFDIKYYSKYFFRTASGTWEARPTANQGDDVVICDSDSLQIFLLELLCAMAQQTEGTDSTFDIGWAKKELHGDPSAISIEGRLGLYRMYKGEHPDQRKKTISRYGDSVSRGRW